MKKLVLLMLTALVLLTGCQKKAETYDGPLARDNYPVARVSSKSDINWDSVVKAPIEIYKWTESDKFPAYGQMVFVEDYGFVVKMCCLDENPYVVYHNDGDPVYQDSAMEFYIMLSKKGYLNFETNSVGARLQEFGFNNEIRNSVFEKIPEGFAAKAGREGKFWTVTIDVPVEQLQVYYPEVTAETFASGYEFTGNFYKIGTNQKTHRAHYGMWHEVNAPAPNFHLPKYFGKFTME